MAGRAVLLAGPPGTGKVLGTVTTRKQHITITVVVADAGLDFSIIVFLKQ